MVESTSNGEQGAEDTAHGRRGFGNVVMLVVIVGALVLVALVVFAMLGLNGQFLHPAPRSAGLGSRRQHLRNQKSRCGIRFHTGFVLLRGGFCRLRMDSDVMREM